MIPTSQLLSAPFINERIRGIEQVTPTTQITSEDWVVTKWDTTSPLIQKGEMSCIIRGGSPRNVHQLLTQLVAQNPTKPVRYHAVLQVPDNIQCKIDII